MAEKFRFFDPVEISPGVFDREYNAQEFTEYFATLINTGLMKGFGSELEVTADGASMETSIASGIAFIDGRYYESTGVTHEHDLESIGVNRIDRIVVRMDLRTEARHVLSFIKKGTAAASPVAPALTRNEEVYDISLAQVYITGGQSFIAPGDVTDERGDETLCPYASSNIFPSYDQQDLDNLIQEVGALDQRQTSHEADFVRQPGYGITGGSGNAYTVSTDPAPTAYVDGMGIVIRANRANTGESTLNWNALGTRNIVDSKGNALTAGKIPNGARLSLRYSSAASNFQLQGEGGSGNATASDLLSGKTASTDAGDIVGTMPNRGSVGTQTITTQNGEYTIPEGYHNGIGKVRATFPNLIASNIRKDINVGGIIGTMIEGVRVLSGQKQTSGQATFYLANDSVVTCLKFELVLDFKPRYVYLRATQGSPARRTIYSSFEDTYNFHAGVPNANVLVFRPPTSGNALSSHLIYKSNILPAKVDNTGIVLPIELGDGSNVNINWFVVE